jgi:hypothetical protein
MTSRISRTNDQQAVIDAAIGGFVAAVITNGISDLIQGANRAGYECYSPARSYCSPRVSTRSSAGRGPAERPTSQDVLCLWVGPRTGESIRFWLGATCGIGSLSCMDATQQIPDLWGGSGSNRRPRDHGLTASPLYGTLTQQDFRRCGSSLAGQILVSNDHQFPSPTAAITPLNSLILPGHQRLIRAANAAKRKGTATPRRRLYATDGRQSRILRSWART